MSDLPHVEDRDPWVPAGELRRILREAPADGGLLTDLADIRGGIWERFDRRFDPHQDPRGEPEPLTCTRGNDEVAEIGGLLFSVEPCDRSDSRGERCERRGRPVRARGAPVPCVRYRVLLMR